MQLTVKERLMLFNVLPTTGKALTLWAVEDFRKAMQQSLVADAERYSIKQDGQQWTFTDGLSDEIAVPPLAHEAVVAALTKLDTDAALTADQLTLYAKFVGGSNA